MVYGGSCATATGSSWPALSKKNLINVPLALPLICRPLTFETRRLHLFDKPRHIWGEVNDKDATVWLN